MTPAQIELSRHALGLNYRQTRLQSYRNHFVCGPGHPDWNEWCKMVEAGDAERIRPSALTGGDHFFRLTRAGAEKALKPGESLDSEDFT